MWLSLGMLALELSSTLLHLEASFQRRLSQHHPLALAPTCCRRQEMKKGAPMKHNAIPCQASYHSCFFLFSNLYKTDQI